MFQGPQHVPALPHHSRKHGEKSKYSVIRKCLPLKIIFNLNFIRCVFFFFFNFAARIRDQDKLTYTIAPPVSKNNTYLLQKYLNLTRI